MSWRPSVEDCESRTVVSSAQRALTASVLCLSRFVGVFDIIFYTNMLYHINKAAVGWLEGEARAAGTSTNFLSADQEKILDGSA